MAHTRAHIRFNLAKEVNDFVKKLNSDGTANKYVIENFDGSYRVDARSYLGVIYMTAEYGDETYFVNVTNDGEFPLFIDNYRF